MRKSKSLIICDVRPDATSGAIGLFRAENGDAQVNPELLKSFNAYFKERYRVDALLQGKGIATIRDPNVISAWRRLNEIVLPLLVTEIRQQPATEQSMWFTLLYRQQIKLCFFVGRDADISSHQIAGLDMVKGAVLASKGRITTLVARVPSRYAVRQVLRLAPSARRFVFDPECPSNFPSRVRGLSVIDTGHPLLEQPLIQRCLSLQ